MGTAGDLHSVRGGGERPAQLLPHQGPVIADEQQTAWDAVVGPVVDDCKSPQLRGRARFPGHGRSVVGRQAQCPGTATGPLPPTCGCRPEVVLRRKTRLATHGCLCHMFLLWGAMTDAHSPACDAPR